MYYGFSDWKKTANVDIMDAGVLARSLHRQEKGPHDIDFVE